MHSTIIVSSGGVADAVHDCLIVDALGHHGGADSFAAQKSRFGKVMKNLTRSCLSFDQDSGEPSYHNGAIIHLHSPATKPASELYKKEYYDGFACYELWNNKNTR